MQDRKNFELDRLSLLLCSGSIVRSSIAASRDHTGKAADPGSNFFLFLERKSRPEHQLGHQQKANKKSVYVATPK